MASEAGIPSGSEDIADGATVPTTDNLQDSLTLKDEGTPQLPDGGGVSSDTTPLGGEVKEGKRRIISSADLLEQCKKTLTDPMGQLWGYNLRPKAVTLLVGETSAGKTTFLHNLAYRLALGEEFLGYSPPRPLRVLYVDYESGEHIIAEHLTTIGTAKGWDFFDLREDVLRDTSLTKPLMEGIKTGRYDVVILDSLMEAYPVDDENDNSKGAAQMLKVRELAQQTGAAVLVVHNAGQKAMGKKNRTTAKNLARGASVRLDKADVVLNYTINGPKESQQRVLEVVKSRGSNLNTKIVIRFAGDLGFEVIEDTGDNSQVVRDMEHRILSVLGIMAEEGNPEVTRGSILLWLDIKQEDKSGSQIVDRALTNLLRAQKLIKIKRGIYRLPTKGEGEPESAAA